MKLQSLIDNSNNLLEIINQNLKPKDIEKKQFGEVFTPLKLINEMLDKLPKYVWKNKNLKWLDPSSGIGNFSILIYFRLLEELKHVIINDNERKKHILENMLYMSELNIKNTLICKQFFDINNEYKLNIYQGDSLKVNYDDIFKIKKFDIIIGNPPYNASGNTATGNTIWQDFTKKALNEWLLPNGYLLFVHPPGWRKPSTERGKFTGMYDLMTKQNQMLYLEIHSVKDGLKTFNCGTRYDWYLIEKQKKYKNTILIDIDNIKNDIDLSLFNWLPNNNILTILNLINSHDKIKVICDFNYSRLDKKIVSNTQTDDFIYPLIYLTPKKGIRYMYSKVNNKGHFGISKVIIGETGMENAINDFEGKYGMTQDSFGIFIDNKQDGDDIIKVLNNPIFIDLIRITCSWSNFRIDYRLFKEFKKDFWKTFL